MLPPQLRQAHSLSCLTSARPLLSRTLPVTTATRSIWSLRRASNSYTSHLDPMFHRFTRYRTLKTRAKLIKRLRRQEAWDLDASQRPFFTSRQVRLASHFNGSGRPRWTGEVDPSKEQKEEKEEGESGYELNQRELDWKDKMDWMRRQAEMDPYEVVFGKRIQPFWHALAPNWLSDEMPTRDSPKSEPEVKDRTAPKTDVKATPKPKPMAVKKDAETDSGDDLNGQLTNYSYASSTSTSWNPWTNKTQRTEWDSVSGETRRYEYDPISHRMVRVQLSEPQHPVRNREEESTIPEKIGKDTINKQLDIKESIGSRAETLKKESNDVRKAISVPTESTVPENSPYFPSLLTSSPRSIPSPSPDRASVPTPKEKDTADAIDTLTARDIRAAMGRNKKPSAGLPAGDAKFDDHEASSPSRPLQPSLDRLGKKELPARVELDDSAAHESTGDGPQAKVPGNWDTQADLLQSDRVRRTRGGLSSAGEFELWGRPSSKVRWIDDMNARKAAYEAKVANAKTILTKADVKKEKARALLEKEIAEQNQRMQAHETHRRNRLEKARERRPDAKLPEAVQTMVDSAELLERYRQKNRSQRAELDAAFKQSSIQSEMHLERIQKLEAELSRFKMNETLDVEKTQPELESREAKIRDLEAELAKFDKTRYVQKIRDLKAELDRTFQQSARQGEMHARRFRDLEQESNLRIQELEQQLKDMRQPTSHSATAAGVEAVQAEGDFCANVVKHAKDESKWYKRPVFKSAVEQPAENDDALVQEVKGIYENRYGRIDTSHRQTKQVAEQEQTSEESSAVDDALAAYEVRKSGPRALKTESKAEQSKLGNALADYDQSQEYSFTRDGLAKEMAEGKTTSQAKNILDPLNKFDTVLRRQAAEEIAAHEAQAIAKTGQEASPAQDEVTVSSTVTWADPPVYQILAYDAGNDMIVTATSSSNFTEVEAPISIQQALHQLYQPARFLPRFAELQKDGFQVIHATKDLLMFRKVKQSAGLEDHGLIDPTSNENIEDVTHSQEVASSINPIDGTGRSPPEEPNTGSFASPTGFVGDRFDALHPRDEEASSSSSEYPHPSHVRRQERVFSGRSSLDLTRHMMRQRRDRFARTARPSSSHQDKRRGWRSRAKWVLSVGVGSAGLAYTVGAIAERKERRQQERWQSILEGSRARWE